MSRYRNILQVPKQEEPERQTQQEVRETLLRRQKSADIELNNRARPVCHTMVNRSKSSATTCRQCHSSDRSINTNFYFEISQSNSNSCSNNSCSNEPMSSCSQSIQAIRSRSLRKRRLTTTCPPPKIVKKLPYPYIWSTMASQATPLTRFTSAAVAPSAAPVSTHLTDEIMGVTRDSSRSAVPSKQATASTTTQAMQAQAHVHYPYHHQPELSRPRPHSQRPKTNSQPPIDHITMNTTIQELQKKYLIIRHKSPQPSVTTTTSATVAQQQQQQQQQQWQQQRQTQQMAASTHQQPPLRHHQQLAHESARYQSLLRPQKQANSTLALPSNPPIQRQAQAPAPCLLKTHPPAASTVAQAAHAFDSNTQTMMTNMSTSSTMMTKITKYTKACHQDAADSLSSQSRSSRKLTSSDTNTLPSSSHRVLSAKKLNKNCKLCMAYINYISEHSLTTPASMLAGQRQSSSSSAVSSKIKSVKVWKLRIPHTSSDDSFLTQGCFSSIW